MSRTHELKTVPPYFDMVWKRIKRFEIRKNDRDFQPDDIVILREWSGGQYTGRELRRRISIIIEEFSGLEEGYCVFGLEAPDF